MANVRFKPAASTAVDDRAALFVAVVVPAI